MQDIMGVSDIAFPNLGIYLKNVPQFIPVGNFNIAIYGVLIGIAMVLGILLAARLAKETGWDPEIIWDISVWIIIFAIVGARLYYVIFFWDMYKDDPIQIFNLRAGGLAVYGGVIACMIMIVVYCRIKKINAGRLMDCCTAGLVLGQIIGRWGNFFNREVFGGYTNSLLAMRLPIEMVRERDISASLAATIVDGTNYIQVHPTFLYEGLWNCVVLLLMLFWTKRKKFHGEVALLYFFGYGVGRTWIEYMRTDRLYIGNTKIPVSIVVSLIMIVGSIAIDLYMRAKISRKPAYMEEIPEENTAEASAEVTEKTE